jgi:hypothetical protein
VSVDSELNGAEVVAEVTELVAFNTVVASGAVLFVL